MELSNRRVVESSNGGMMELLNRRFVEWWNGGVGGVVESSIDGVVDSSNR